MITFFVILLLFFFINYVWTGCHCTPFILLLFFVVVTIVCDGVLAGQKYQSDRRIVNVGARAKFSPAISRCMRIL